MLKPICSKHLFHFPNIFQAAPGWQVVTHWSIVPCIGHNEPRLLCTLGYVVTRRPVGSCRESGASFHNAESWKLRGHGNTPAPSHQPPAQPSNINHQSVSKRSQIVCVLIVFARSHARARICLETCLLPITMSPRPGHTFLQQFSTSTKIMLICFSDKHLVQFYLFIHNKNTRIQFYYRILRV